MINNQQQVVLSLGSNINDRLKNIEKAIQLIHFQIGTVVRVSKLYETPAWGFKSELFYNCVLLIHTILKPTKLLSKILKIEKELGRIRHNKSGYEARVIDIDIIAYNEDIIFLENLQIPHSLMHKRNFVLLPFKDLNWNWKHPVFNKNIQEIIENCSDESECKELQKLKSPTEKSIIKKQHYIAFEGNIGVGKTTLAQKIATDFNGKLLLERFAENPFLSKFYKDPKRYAFPLEMSFMSDRYKQLNDDLTSVKETELIIADYYILKSLIFAEITLNTSEFEVYKSLFSIIHKNTKKPDLYVYLCQNTTNLLKNIKKRGRNYEKNIDSNYLDKIHLGYFNFIKTQTEMKVLVIDVADLDFEKNQEDYLKIINEIEKILYKDDFS